MERYKMLIYSKLGSKLKVNFHLIWIGFYCCRIKLASLEIVLSSNKKKIVFCTLKLPNFRRKYL